MPNMHLFVRSSCVALALALTGAVGCSKPAGSVEPGPDAETPGGDAGACRPTGCSSQVCAAEDVTTTCEFRPEYACYQSAACEAQADGQCGWTMTPELEACLADPPGGDAAAAESPDGDAADDAAEAAPDESAPE